MKPEDLRHLRGKRTRADLAEELGCSSGAIVQWENGDRSIPAWVEEKMLRTTKIEMPLEDLGTLISYAQDKDIPFETLLGQAIKDFLKAKQTSHPERDIMMLNEEPKEYTAPPKSKRSA